MIKYKPSAKDKKRWTWAAETISLAVDVTNELLETDEFYDRISNKDTDFDHANIRPDLLAEILKKNELVAQVKLFRKLFYRANAYASSKTPTIIFINVMKLKTRSIESISSTLIHELIHLIDFKIPEYRFGHGDNSAKKKENTAPYWIDNLAYNMLTNKPAKVILQHDLITVEDFNKICEEYA